MFTCSNCGASVREGAKFCTSCGTRLNDTLSSNPDSTWSTSSSQEATPSPDVEPTTAAEIQAEDTSVAVPDDSNTPADDNADSIEVNGATNPEVAETPVDDKAVSSDGFTWSWAKAEESDDAPSDELGLVEVESGMVVEKDESSADQESETIVDATEIEILEVEPAMSDDDQNTDEQARAHDQAGDIETVSVAREAEEGDESETLAAWAEQWNEPAENDDSSTIPDTLADVATPVAADQIDDEEEDTVARAERLIGELQAMIPTLVRPKPSAPVVSSDSSAIADQLANAAQSDNFDDLREALETVRDNPRDIDSMLKLSGQADRLLALLDDRNNLAKSAEDAASQLRGTITPREL